MAINVLPGQVVTERNGVPVRVLANGAMQRLDNGRMAAPPTDAPGRITSSEQAKELAHTRWHGKRQAAIMEAVQEKIKSKNPDLAGLVKDFGDADGFVTKTLMQQIVLDETENGMTRLNAWELLMKQSGADGTPPKGNAQQTQASTVAQQVGEAVLSHIYGLLDARMEQD